MKKLISANTKIDLSCAGIKYEFEVFHLPTDYDFSENLEIGEEDDAIYIFTRRIIHKLGYIHNLIYCGKTSDIEKRFDGHHKKEDILDKHANCICLHFCKNSELSKIEDEILSTFLFPTNDINNTGKYDDSIKEVTLSKH